MKYILLMLVQFLVSSAYGASTCNEALLPEKGVLQTADRVLINEILENSNYLPRQQWLLVKNIYMAARLRALPEQDRTKVELLLKSLLIQYNSNGILNASVKGINIPIELKDTALSLIILVHELEHRIEEYYETPDNNPDLRFFYDLRYKLSPLRMYKSEKEAMMAEWEISSALPQFWMNQSFIALGKLTLDSDTKTALATMLDQGYLSREAYVKAHHQNGRYSAKDVSINAVKLWFKLGQRAAIIGVPCALTLKAVDWLF